MTDALKTLNAKAWSMALVSLLCVGLPVHAELERPTPQAPAGSSYVAGELLVKFAEEAAEAVEQARAANTLPMVGIESLDVLMATYGVTNIEPVFLQAQDPDAIREKFPDRSRRAPPGAEVPDLSRTYKLTLDPDNNLAGVLIAFLNDPHVELAEPNYTATIQVPPEPVP